MTDNKTKFNLLKEAGHLLILIISMAGYVPKNAKITRIGAILASLGFALYLADQQSVNSTLAVLYFFISEISYIGFISVVLSKNGLRHWFIRKWGSEKKGYIAYETALGFLFFHNAVSIGHVASSTPDNLFSFINKEMLLILVALMFISGFAIKLIAAKVVTIEIYYWKDMFLGRKISDFVNTGPYKYFSNPMYGIGQLQAYAVAIWYGSIIGLIAAFLNQILIFSFYFLVEKKFIEKFYKVSDHSSHDEGTLYE